jgi:hypothetical protein
MGIEVTSLREIDPGLVLSTEKLLRALIAAYSPDVDTNGALAQLLLRPHALLYSATRTEVDRLRRSSSLYALMRDPALASTEVVDAAMSNFALQRRQATPATCVLTLTFASTATVIIPADTVFTAAGRDWKPGSQYVAMDSPGDLDTMLVFAAHPSGAGYWVQLPVVATTAGTADVPAGTRFSLPEIKGLYSAVAASPASGGRDLETNEELVARAVASISPTSAATREGVERIIRQADPSVLAVRVIGFGDVELARSRHNMFSISTPGMADIYVRTTRSPHIELLKTRGFTRVTREQLSPERTMDYLDVRVEVTGHLRSGAYEVIGVMLTSPDSLGISAAEALEQDLAVVPHTHERVPAADALAFAPTAADAAFSAVQGTVYATAAIPLHSLPQDRQTDAHRFSLWQTYWKAWYVQQSDTTTEDEKNAAYSQMVSAMQALGGSSVSSEFSAEFEAWAWVVTMPGLTVLQNAVLRPEVKAPVDYLVRAFNPCFVSVGLKLLYYGSGAGVDTDEVIREVTAVINSTEHTATRGVRAADIAAAVSKVIGTSAVLEMPISLRGRLRLPTDDVVEISSGTELRVPGGYEALGVSPRTTAFYATAADVAVELEAAT